MHIEAMHIGLQAMRFYAYHVVLPQERQVGNYFTVEIEVWADVSKSLTTDALEDTLSYADLYTVIQEEMTLPSKLLEHVVGRIARRLFASFAQIDRIIISLKKDNPPFPGELHSSSFTLEASRHK